MSFLQFPSSLSIASAFQKKRLAQEIADIEKDTGFKLRVLAQNYPDTPGHAIRDYWKVDDRTIVFVADPTFGIIEDLREPVGPSNCSEGLVPTTEQLIKPGGLRQSRSTLMVSPPSLHWLQNVLG